MALLEVIISCEHGAFYVPTMSGIYVKETNETAKNKTIILQGSEQYLNLALSSLQYVPDLEYSGDDTIKLNVTDFGNTGAQNSESINVESTIKMHIVAVDDKPSMSIRAEHVYINPLEDTKYTIKKYELIN